MREIELPSPARAGFLSGEAGILTVAWQLAPDDALADTLYERVTENAENEANEIMWGPPGTMLAAHAMHEWTGNETLGGQPGRRAPTSFCAGARTTGSGRSTSTARRIVASGLLTASSATSARCVGVYPRIQKERHWSGTTAASAGHTAAVVEDGLANWGPGPTSGAWELLGSSSRRPITWTRSCCLPVQGLSGRRGRTATRRATASVTARPGTATRYSRRSGAPVTNAGFSARAASPFMHWSRQSGSQRAEGDGATRSGPETWAPRSSPLIASTPARATRSWTE